METITLGEGAFRDAAAREDDLGGGRIYAALVKQAVYRAWNRAGGAVLFIREGDGEAYGFVSEFAGAVIADTQNYSDIPMQFVAPPGFGAKLAGRVDLSTCTIGEFMDALIEQCGETPVVRWNTFAVWLNEYTGYYAPVSVDPAVTFSVIGGEGAYPGTMRTPPEFSGAGDLFRWVKSLMGQTMLDESGAVLISPVNQQKLGFSAVCTGLQPMVFTDGTARLSFAIRL